MVSAGTRHVQDILPLSLCVSLIANVVATAISVAIRSTHD